MNDVFPKISGDFPKLFRRPDERFRTFCEDYRRLPKTTEEDPKMFRSYINKFKSSLRDKRKMFSKRDDIFTVGKIKIGPQCELVWDFSQIRVDALWINQRNCSFVVNIYTFCRFVVMNVE